jgi:hypothetical protein
LAVLAGEVGVFPIQFDNCPAAFANESKARGSEARSDGFQVEGLGTAAMAEFNRTAGEPDAR